MGPGRPGLLLLLAVTCLFGSAGSQNLPTSCPKVQAATCVAGAAKATQQLVAASVDLAARGTCSTSDTTGGPEPLAACNSPDDDNGPSPSAQPPYSAGSQQQLRLLLQQQAAVAAGGVPQRVQPGDSPADKPVETPEQQQQIIRHLQALLLADLSSDSEPAPEEPALEPAPLLRSPAAAAATVPNRATAAPAAAAPAYTGPTSQVSRSLTFLENGRVKVGLDMQRAGAISWVSSTAIPAPWTGKNLVNVWDQGRLLQQSFYGCVDGSCWSATPWLFNPVQGGAWDNSPGQTVKQVVKPKQSIYVEGYPRNWGKADVIKQVLLTSNVTLKDNVDVIVSRFTMKYSGSVTHPYMTQEVPAVFVDRRFSVLAYYAGSKPWTRDTDGLTYAFPPGRNVYARPSENWAAFIDPVTGWGVGVFNPMAWMGITAYRVGQDGSDKPWDCSYFAHTIRMQLHKGMAPYSYNVYITVDKLANIRATFAKLRATPGVMPVSAKADAPPAPLNPADFLAQGQPDLGRNSQFGRLLNSSSFSNVDLAAAAAAVQAAAGSGSSSGSAAAGSLAGKAGLGGTAGSPAGEGEPGGGGRVLPGRHSSGSAGGLLAGVLVAGVTVGGAMLAAIRVAVSRRQRQRAAGAAAEGTAEAAAAARGAEGPVINEAVVTAEENTDKQMDQVPCGTQEVNLLATSAAGGEPAAAAADVSADDPLAMANAAVSPVLLATPTAASPGVTTRAAAALLRRAQQQQQQP